MHEMFNYLCSCSTLYPTNIIELSISILLAPKSIQVMKVNDDSYKFTSIAKFPHPRKQKKKFYTSTFVERSLKTRELNIKKFCISLWEDKRSLIR